MSTDELVSQRDLSFQLYEVLHAEALTRRARYADHSRETFDAALDTSLAIATEKFAPHNRLADENEPRLVEGRVQMVREVGEAVQAICAAGLQCATADYEAGGMQLPEVVAEACWSLFRSANIATTSYVGLHRPTRMSSSDSAARPSAPATCRRCGQGASSARWC